MAVYNSIAFANETSKSNTMVVDKIRFMKNGKYGYIDIHYDTSALNYVTVRFDVKTSLIDYQFAATTPTAVADEPSGESELAFHAFAANYANGIIVSQSATNPPSAYPEGVSIFQTGSSTSFPRAYGTVATFIVTTGRGFQMNVDAFGNFSVRAINDGAWGAWKTFNA